MRRLWIAVAVLMFTAVGHAGRAEASFFSGTDLLEACESDQPSTHNVCMGYIAAIDDMHVTYAHWGFKDKEICVPDGVDTGQLRRGAIKGLNEKPEKLHKDAAPLVYFIMRSAFPCD